VANTWDHFNRALKVAGLRSGALTPLPSRSPSLSFLQSGWPTKSIILLQTYNQINIGIFIEHLHGYTCWKSSTFPLCLFTVLRPAYHLYGDVTIALKGSNILAYARLLGPFNRGDPYRDIPCVPWGLGFSKSYQKEPPPPFNCLFRHTGMWRIYLKVDAEDLF
jgi:hypothetical protein